MHCFQSLLKTYSKNVEGIDWKCSVYLSVSLYIHQFIMHFLIGILKIHSCCKNNPTLYFSRSAKRSYKNKMKVVMYNISISDTMSAMRTCSKYSNNVTTSLEGWEFNTNV